MESPPLATTPTLASAPPTLGDDRYQLAAELGHGAMGRVFLARDRKLGRDVAVKVLAQQSPEWVRRFEREARAAAAIEHPNVLAVFDIGAAESGPFIVSELLRVAFRISRTMLSIIRLPMTEDSQ